MTTTAEAIKHCFESEEVPSPTLNCANMVDVVSYVANATRKVAQAISADAGPGTDAAGGTVTCLTESVMGVTAGLHSIAEAISDLAQAIREHGD